MMNLGTFEKDERTGILSGTFYAIGLQPTLLTLEPTVSRRGRQYYKIFAHSQNSSAEAGAGWPKASKSEGATPYIDVKLNSPAFGTTFYGKLYPSDVIPNQNHLLWDEPQPKPQAKLSPTPPAETKPADLVTA